MRSGLVLQIIAAVVISALAIAGGVWYTARQRREEQYAAELNKYSEAVHAGMSRKEVENYLRSRSIAFTWDCGTQCADLVQIGKESTLCGDEPVYVAFKYASMDALDIFYHRDSGVLEKIQVYKPARGCIY